MTISINIEIIYISQEGTIFQKAFEVTNEYTIQDVLVISGLYQEFPETKDFKVGIFGELVDRMTCVQDGNRIEVYRPLQLTPEENRKKRDKGAI